MQVAYTSYAFCNCVILLKVRKMAYYSNELHICIAYCDPEQNICQLIWSVLCYQFELNVRCAFTLLLTLFQTTDFHSFEVKMVADNNFKTDKNGRKFSKWVENIVGKGESAHYEQFLLFSSCFQKTCTVDT